MTAIVADLTNVLDQLSQLEAAILRQPSDSVDPDFGPTLDAYKNFLYRLSEHYEFLGKLPDEFSAPKATRIDFEAKWKRHKRHATIVCNKVKHEHNRLCYKRTLYPSGEYSHGFSVYRYSKGMLIPNKDIFPSGRESASFNLRLRADICDLLSADIAGARLCAAVFGEAKSDAQSAIPDYQLKMLVALARLDARPELGFVKERSEKVETFRLKDGQVVVGPQQRRDTLPPKAVVRITQRFDPDGATLIYKLADSEA
jgi:hypothetical protein